MTTSETYIPRPVVMYFFVAPSQKMVRWNYASIRDAKKVWHATRLQAAASVPLQPWTSSVHWRYSEEAPRAVYAVEPMNKPVLRYQGGDVVPLNLLGRASGAKGPAIVHTRKCSPPNARWPGGFGTSSVWTRRTLACAPPNGCTARTGTTPGLPATWIATGKGTARHSGAIDV